ncbi:MAG: 1-acyl-sn-glycerol-3-phosphate acyltransferase [Prevotella sp.]|nr:1-acyl-sn-glycerol-3-phosphate acyltransferase [Prevotella sp.]
MTFVKRFSRWMLYKCMGWTIDVTVPHPDKYIICLAPHTSNWDFLIGQLYSRAEDVKSGFLMKKEWFFWPLGSLFKSLGGIPVWRSKKTSMTDNLAETALKEKEFHLCITPEGTRSLTTEWKRGFYYIALKAGIPILLYGVDYKKKVIRCTKYIIPNGNIEEQMREIKLYFRDFKGKYPEKFSIGDI